MNRAGTKSGRKPGHATVSGRTRTAYHEAGHAVLGAILNETPESVSIRPEPTSSGRSFQRTLAPPRLMAQVCLAGFAAECLLTGQQPDGMFQQAAAGSVYLLNPGCPRIPGYPWRDTDGERAVHFVLDAGAWPTVHGIGHCIGFLYRVTLDSLSAAWPAVEAVARALLLREELHAPTIRTILRRHPVKRSVLAIQRSRGLIPSLSSRRNSRPRR